MIPRGAQLDLKYSRGAMRTYICVCPTCGKVHKVKSHRPQSRWIYCPKHLFQRNISAEGYDYIGAQR